MVRQASSAAVLCACLAYPLGNARAQSADTAGAHPALAPASVPFASADFSWVPGNAGASERPLTAGPLTGEFRMDNVYHYDFSDPKDHTISGSSEMSATASSRSRRSASAATSCTRTSWAG